jgi:hypothetical protein
MSWSKIWPIAPISPIAIEHRTAVTSTFAGTGKCFNLGQVVREFAAFIAQKPFRLNR